MKLIEELKTIKGDAYDYYDSSAEETILFEKIFLVDEVMEEIADPGKFFLIGEKGSGKTAYSVYLSKNKKEDLQANIIMVENTLYHKFMNMKRQKMLELTEIKDIWINILYLVLAENLKRVLKKDFFSGRRIKVLDHAVRLFYSDAFKPELINAMEFVENANRSINIMAQEGLFSSGFTKGNNKQKTYTEQTYQISLLKIQKEFEAAFSELFLKTKYILFVDGVDARPSDIDNKDYFECISGLTSAVMEMNRGVLGEKGIKIMPLMRPDVMYRLPIHNLNQKLRDKSVLLNWHTTYRRYVESKLFQIADSYFAKQQDKVVEFQLCWNHYFPYRIHRYDSRGEDNPFVEFLRYSTYKPRDILTMLNEMVIATKGNTFTHEDFKRMIHHYSEYLEGELKDYLLIYMTDENYVDFRMFFNSFYGNRKFDYRFFSQKHLKYVEYLHKLGRKVPPGMETPTEALQLLYDANVIGYSIMSEDGKKMNHWSYRERSYANMRPNIPPNNNYMFHLAYANVFGII